MMRKKKGSWYANGERMLLVFDDTKDLTIKEAAEGLRNARNDAEKDGRKIKKVKLWFRK